MQEVFDFDNRESISVFDAVWYRDSVKSRHIMSSDQLAANLRLLTSYGRSVADICRKAGFNRQQFTKYLSGAARPSLASLRRICDFFGVEEHEILRDEEAFRALIRLRPPRLGKTDDDPVTQFFTTLAGRHDLDAAAKLAGYYFLHMQDEPRSPTITRSLLRMTPEARCLSIKGVERFLPNVPGLPRVLKYVGFAVVSEGRVYVAVDEILAHRSLWFGMHYASDFSGVSFLNGLSLGIDPQSRREILAARMILQYLGPSIDIKRELKRCGALPLDSPDIDPVVRYATRNDLTPGETVLMPRL